LRDAKLILGDVSEESTTDPAMIGKVINQKPEPGTEASPDSTVEITIGKAAGEAVSPATKVKAPDLRGNTRDQAEQALLGAGLAIGAVSEEQTGDREMVGKVIRQTPEAETEAERGSKVDVVIGKATG
jgi:serine/threonine-protein kinase